MPTFNNYNNNNKDKLKKRKHEIKNEEQYLDNKEKRQRKAERKSHRKNSSLIESSKTIWIKLIQTTNTKTQTAELMKELMSVITNSIQKLVLQHDASRIIQAAVKFGNESQRKIVLMELEDVLLEIANCKYSRFVVCKLIQTLCDKSVKNSATYRKVILKAFKGHVHKLAYHKFGSQVLNDIYKTFPSKDYAVLKQEFYPRQYTLFNNQGTLSDILENHKDKRNEILSSQYDILQKAMDKELLDKYYFHDLVHDYMNNCTVSELESSDVISTLSNTHAIQLLSSKVGTFVFCTMCKNGTSKDRRQIIRDLLNAKDALKEYILSKDSYIGILTLLHVTDDTKATGKILKALLDVVSAPTRKEVKVKSPLLEYATSDVASKLFLLLLPDDYATSTPTSSPKKYFDTTEQDILFTSFNSKKDGEIRRKELCAFLQEDLCALCLNHALELVTNKVGVHVLREFYNSYPSVELMSAIITAYKTQEEDRYHLFEDPIAHLFIKNLFLSESSNKKDTRAYYKSQAVSDLNESLAKKFLEAFRGELGGIVHSNRGAFVISALADVECVRGDVRTELEGVDIKGMVEKENGGHACLLRCLED